MNMHQHLVIKIELKSDPAPAAIEQSAPTRSRRLSRCDNSKGGTRGMEMYQHCVIGLEIDPAPAAIGRSAPTRSRRLSRCDSFKGVTRWMTMKEYKNTRGSHVYKVAPPFRRWVRDHLLNRIGLKRNVSKIPLMKLYQCLLAYKKNLLQYSSQYFLKISTWFV